MRNNLSNFAGPGHVRLLSAIAWLVHENLVFKDTFLVLPNLSWPLHDDSIAASSCKRHFAAFDLEVAVCEGFFRIHITMFCPESKRGGSRLFDAMQSQSDQCTLRVRHRF